MLRRARGTTRRRTFGADTRGVSAVEFAVAAPVMLVLMLVGVDTSRYVVATRRIEAVAATVGEMISVNTSGQLTPTEARFYMDSAMVIYPQVLADSRQRGIAWGQDIGVTTSSLAFSSVNGATQANTMWSVGSTLRPCTQPMLAVADTAAPSPTTLPQDAFGTGTLIVVDVAFTFRPTIALNFMPPIPITRSFYMQPRYVQSIAYTGSAGPNVNFC